jgi:predicted negative regulator of RcsB-dependent stress response
MRGPAGPWYDLALGGVLILVILAIARACGWRWW